MIKLINPSNKTNPIQDSIQYSIIESQLAYSISPNMSRVYWGLLNYYCFQ